MSQPENAYERWQKTFRTENSRMIWSRYAELYRKHRNMSWDELIDERKKTFYPPQTLPLEEAGMLKRTVERHVEDFLRKMEAAKFAPSTIRTASKAIRSFYREASYKTMDLDLRNFRMPRGTVIDSLPPTAEEIGELLKHGSLRERAIVAFLAETGWGPELLSSAKVGWIDRSEGMPYIILTKRGKTGEKVVTFLGRRGAELLDAYLETRNNPKEDDPLFFNYFNVPLNSKAINQTIVRLAIEAKLNKKIYGGKERNVEKNSFHAYSLRHFFQTTMEDARVSTNWVKAMMGHSLGEVEGAYSKPRILNMRKAYEQAYPALIGSGAAPLSAPNLNQETLNKLLAVVKELSKDASPAVQQNVEKISQALDMSRMPPSR